MNFIFVKIILFREILNILPMVFLLVLSLLFLLLACWIWKTRCVPTAICSCGSATCLNHTMAFAELEQEMCRISKLNDANDLKSRIIKDRLDTERNLDPLKKEYSNYIKMFLSLDEKRLCIIDTIRLKRAS